MRPHVELVHEQDLVWHNAELPGGEGRVRQQNLSYDEENGAGSFKVYFESDWGRPAGFHSADTEWFVLEGRVHLGDQDFGPGGFRLGGPAGPSRSISKTPRWRSYSLQPGSGPPLAKAERGLLVDRSPFGRHTPR